MRRAVLLVPVLLLASLPLASLPLASLPLASAAASDDVRATIARAAIEDARGPLGDLRGRGVADLPVAGSASAARLFGDAETFLAAGFPGPALGALAQFWARYDWWDASGGEEAPSDEETLAVAARTRTAWEPGIAAWRDAVNASYGPEDPIPSGTFDRFLWSGYLAVQGLQITEEHDAYRALVAAPEEASEPTRLALLFRARAPSFFFLAAADAAAADEEGASGSLRVTSDTRAAAVAWGAERWDVRLRTTHPSAAPVARFARGEEARDGLVHDVAFLSAALVAGKAVEAARLSGEAARDPSGAEARLVSAIDARIPALSSEAERLRGAGFGLLVLHGVDEARSVRTFAEPPVELLVAARADLSTADEAVLLYGELSPPRTAPGRSFGILVALVATGVVAVLLSIRARARP